MQKLSRCPCLHGKQSCGEGQPSVPGASRSVKLESVTHDETTLRNVSNFFAQSAAYYCDCATYYRVSGGATEDSGGKLQVSLQMLKV